MFYLYTTIQHVVLLQRKGYNIMEKKRKTGTSGVKDIRFNLPLDAKHKEYVSLMSGFYGLNMTQFLTGLIDMHMKEHGKEYAALKKRRDDFG